MDSLDQNIMDKSMRSVFVGNIPYEATEEKLKDIFGEVGQVLSFKLVFDRETGKPKGYGFCEYRDQETALSAMRNLNGYEIGGRNLRVDNACTEKSRMEMQNLLNQPPVENPYGEPIQAEKAPEAISKAVASLPPEQMFELMKQMKQCIQNNPTEARNMLLQNPQLTYALLQAQVVMRIIDPQTAASMLHPQTAAPSPLSLADKPPPVVNNIYGQALTSVSGPLPPVVAPIHPIQQQQQQQVPRPFGDTIGNSAPGIIFDNRNTDPRIGRNMTGDLDMRQMPPAALVNPLPAANDNFPRDPRSNFNDPRQVQPPALSQRVDPRSKPMPVPVPPVVARPSIVPGPVQAPVTAQTLPIRNMNVAANIGPSGASDQEKAALIMQVLQLSDEQIAMLPPEQRVSILALKDQIAKSTQR